jgi:hypothetical protein
LREFFGYDIKYQGFYCHTDGVVNWKSGVLEDVAFVNGRYSDGALRGVGIATEATLDVKIRRAYVEGYYTGFSPSDFSTKLLEDSIFKSCSRITISGGTTFRNNIVGFKNAADSTDVNKRGSSLLAEDTDALIENNLFVHQHDPVNVLNSDTNFSAYGTSPAATIQKNIIVLNSPDAGQNTLVRQSTVPTDYTADFNLIITGNGGLHTGLPAPFNNVNNDFTTYQNVTGQDAHSMWVDLRGDTRGLKAVFVDPDSGDFRWAQTAIGKKCADYCKEHGVGPDYTISQWPVLPTVDEAAEYIQQAS